jgi:hypothetical protein
MQAGRVEIEIAAKDRLSTSFPKTAAVVQGQSRKMEGALASVEGQANRTGISIGGIAKAAAGLFVFSKVAGVIRDSVRAAGEAAEAQAKVQAAIKSTGGAAGVTFESLEQMAQGLQKVTTFEDDAILAGQSMLLTFTKIGKNVFPQATETILNMSTALGSDLKSSAIQLGKALNEPVEGISALSRVGVQMTKEQEALIKAFVRVGDVESAQKIILRELEVQMGGLARATAKTGLGPLKQFQNVLGDIQEDLGNALLPVLTESAKKVQAFITSAKESGKLESMFKTFANAVQFTVENVDKLALVGSGLLAVFAVQKLVAVAVAIKGIAVAIQLATMANPLLFAMGLTVTAAGVAFIAARDSAKEFNEEAQNIKEAEKQLAKYESVAQKVAALHQKMTASNPFGDDKFAPKGAKRLPDAPPPKKPGADPLTDAQLKAAAQRKADAKELQSLENDLKYRKALKLEAESALQEQLKRRNAVGDAEYLAGKAVFEAQIQQMGMSSLDAQLATNSTHYDNLRKEAAEWLLDEKALADARVQIAAAESESKKQIYLQLAQAQLATTTDNLNQMASRWKTFGTAYKVAAHSKNVVDTYASATASYASLAGIPYVGPFLGAAAAAAAVGAGLARGAVINAQKFAQGGIVGGNSTSGDKVPAMVNSREMILTQRQQANLFAQANGRGQGGGGVTITGGITINMPPGSTSEDARRFGEAAAEGIYSKMRKHDNTTRDAVYFGVAQ